MENAKHKIGWIVSSKTQDDTDGIQCITADNTIIKIDSELITIDNLCM